MKPHLQRCETCKNIKCKFHPDQDQINYLGSPISEIIHVFTKEKGCASYISDKNCVNPRKELYDEIREEYIKFNMTGECPYLADKYNHCCDNDYCGVCILDLTLESLKNKYKL